VSPWLQVKPSREFVKNEKIKNKCKEAKPPTPKYFIKERDMVLKRDLDINYKDEITFRPKRINILHPSQVTHVGRTSVCLHRAVCTGLGFVINVKL
jgi:hypothetical protein